MPKALLRNADEVWISRSARKIVPITRVNGQIVGEGWPGPGWQRTHAAYWAFKQKVREGKA